MPELRRDPITGAVVIVAPERANRPHTFRRQVAAVPATDPSCPFCPGNEHDTPPEVARVGPGAPQSPGWRLRVTPNLYPAVDAPGTGDGRDGGPASGAHEVLVFTPAHDRSLALLDDAEAADVLLAARERIRHHHRAGRAQAMAFVNHGPAAGASIEHPHGQLVALDFVPPGIAGELDRFATAGTDLVEASLAEARAIGTVVLDGPAAAWCPRAASGPFEALVAAIGGGPRIDDAPDDEVAAVARAVRDLLARLRATLGDAPYNLVLQSAPPASNGPYHWYVRATPRVTVRAGFELASGVLVNTVLPERAAELLRVPGATSDAAPGSASGAVSTAEDRA